MRSRFLVLAPICVIVALVPCGWLLADSSPEAEPPAEKKRQLTYSALTVRGRVVFMAEALKRRFGISSVIEAGDRILAVETPQGRLYPLVENVRGRAFRIDERLRKMDVELVVRQYAGSPMVQILRVYRWKDGQKFQVDYWCDICAIVMFEDGACACCQEPNRLRERLVEKPPSK